jgi:hypothetical protein
LIVEILIICCSQPPEQDIENGSLKITNVAEDSYITNIWADDSEVLYLEGNMFRAGTLNKVVETLTSDESYGIAVYLTF